LNTVQRTQTLKTICCCSKDSPNVQKMDNPSSEVFTCPECADVRQLPSEDLWTKNFQTFQEEEKNKMQQKHTQIELFAKDEEMKTREFTKEKLRKIEIQRCKPIYRIYDAEWAKVREQEEKNIQEKLDAITAERESKELERKLAVPPRNLNPQEMSEMRKLQELDGRSEEQNVRLVELRQRFEQYYMHFHEDKPVYTPIELLREQMMYPITQALLKKVFKEWDPIRTEEVRPLVEDAEKQLVEDLSAIQKKRDDKLIECKEEFTENMKHCMNAKIIPERFNFLTCQKEQCHRA
jgi:hypothetical protein